MYDEGRGVSVDLTRSAGLWKQACDLGSSNGCVGLAVKMFRGDTVSKDVDKAVAILQRECDAGSFYGCAQVALVDAFQLPQPTAQALPLGLRSCNGGDAQGCLAVGHMYKEGKGAPKDLARAKEFMERACQEGKGIGIACGQLGHMPISIDVCESAANFSTHPPNTERARTFYKKACDLGDADSCKALQTLP
jgi:uncharacterized protein